MSLNEIFKENTEIFRGQENRLDLASFEKLKAEHGEEFAMGYLKAVVEITEVIGNAILKTYPSTPDVAIPETHANSYAKMSNLHLALFKFISKNGVDTKSHNQPYPYSTKCKVF